MVDDFSQATTTRGPLQFAKIEVYGKVQGVNFRQMVKQIAMEKELHGQVRNDEKNQRLVHIHVEGSKSSIDDLIAEIEQMKPKPLDHPYLKGRKYYIKTEKVLVSERYPIEKSKRQFSLFEVKYPDDIDPRTQLLAEKLSFDGLVYQEFHGDHNANFIHLDEKFGAISKSMRSAQQDIKELNQTLKGILQAITNLVDVEKGLAC